MSQQFDHEKLNVYHEALAFVGVATDLLERVPKRMAVYDQLDRASTAIPLNIAEGRESSRLRIVAGTMTRREDQLSSALDVLTYSWSRRC